MIEGKKNTAYYLSFPAVDSTTPAAYKTGLSPVDTAYSKDGAGVWTALAITDTAAEIGSTGVYEIDLTAAEMNHDQVIIKFAVSGMADDAYQFDLRTKLVDDLNDFNSATDAVADVTLVATTTTNTDSVQLQSDLDDIQTRLPAALVGGLMSSDVTAISTDTVSADNLELQYDGTGLTGETFPSSQQQLSGIANVGSAVHKTPATSTLTTGTESSGTVANVEALDGVFHEHTDTAGVLLLEYHHLIGSGTPSSVQITGYVSGANDTVLVAGYDWVSASYKQVGSIVGQNGTPVPTPVHSFDLFVDMVGNGADEGKVDIKLYATSGLTTSTTRVDQIFVAFSLGVEGYDNGSVWIDPDATNTNTEVGIDGVARNPVSTIAAANTLLASANLHRLTYSPSTTVVTFAASQTNESHTGHDYTIALGGQDITGIYLSGAVVSGVATATGRFVIQDCELNACTFDNAGLFEHCSIAGTQTIGQAGTYTYHGCFNESGSEITIDFAAIGATTVHLFDFHGEVNFTNMAAGDFVHITGAGTITTTTCTAGTIEHDGFFEYTDAGGNITEQQSDIKVAVDATLVDTGTTIPATITTAQNDLDIITGADGANLLSATQASIDAVEADTNELQTDWTNAGRLDAILDIIAADTTTDIPALIAALNDIAATDIVSAGAITTLTGAVVNVDLVDTTTTNTDMVGTTGANTTVPDAAGTAATLLGTAGASLTDLGGMSTAMKAEVNAEVVDTLNVDTYAEPGQGTPLATTSLAAKINYLFKSWRNKKEQTATTFSLYDDAGTTVDQKSTVSDDATTTTVGEQATGP